MVSQYPHTIIFSSASESTQDANGNFVEAGSDIVSLTGRFETNTQNLFLKAADGNQIVYSGIVYMTIAAPNIAPGTTVEVKTGDDTVAKGSVLQFSRGQLNVRIWIA